MIKRTILGLILSAIVCHCDIVAQISAIDSISFLKQIEVIDKLIESRDYNQSRSIINNMMTKSKSQQFIYGQALCLIKLNEIILAQENYHDLTANLNLILQYGEKINNKLILGIGHLQLAQNLMYTNRANEAEPQFIKALGYLNEDNNYTALAWNERGYNAALLGNLTAQTEYYLKALRKYELINDKSGMAMVYSNLSVLYYDLGKLESAIDYAKKAILIRVELDDQLGLSYSYCNLSQLYLSTNIDESKRLADLCTESAKKINNEGRLIHAITTQGLVKERQGGKNEILNSAIEVMHLLEKSRNPSIDLARQYLSVAIIMSETRLDSLTALTYFNRGLDMALLMGDKISIRDAYLNKTIYYKIRNDFYNAYENIKKYHLYKDSIINSNTQLNIAELQTKYESDKKDNEIARLGVEKKLNEYKIQQLDIEKRYRQLEIQKQHAELAGNKLLVKQKEEEIILLSKESELLDIKVLQQNQLLEKQVLLAKTQSQEMEIIQKEKEEQMLYKKIALGLIFLTSLLSIILFNRYQLKKKISEQAKLIAVRDKIAKDLHDDIGSTLSSIKILSEVSQKNIEKNTQKSSDLLSKIIEQSKEAEQGISDIVWSVKPDNDKVENIIARIRSYVSQTLEPKNINVVFKVDELILKNIFDMEDRRDILLIFKEAINNINKYAQSSEVVFEIENRKEFISFTISDNGVGFDTKMVTNANGLKNMRSRAEKLKAQINIASHLNRGTKIELLIPNSTKA